MFESVESISLRGYQAATPNILDYLKNVPASQHDTATHDSMLVNQEKPHTLYFYDNLFGDMKNRPAGELAIALRCQPTDLNCTTAHELLFSAITRFKSITGFREIIKNTQSLETAQHICESPIILLDPARPIQ